VSKANIRSGLNAFKDDIATVKAKGLEYVLGEANSFSCHVSGRLHFVLPACSTL
jgi:hypothetical protein